MNLSPFVFVFYFVNIAGANEHLLKAAANGEIRRMSRLLRSGAFVNYQSETGGETPLMEALRAGKEEAAEFLMARGANVGVADYRGRVPLHFATDKPKLLKKMVKDGNCDLNAKTMCGSTALDIALLNGNKEGAVILITAAAAAGTPLQKYFPYIINRNITTRGFEDIVIAAASHPDFPYVRDNLLIMACGFGSVSVVTALLDAGVYIDIQDEQGFTPLIMAAFNDFPELVHILLLNGANKKIRSVQRNTPLHYALSRGCKRSAALLMEDGVGIHDIGHCGVSPIHLACTNEKSSELLEKLIDMGGDVNAVDYEGGTPLRFAACFGNAAAAALLISRGANANAIDEKGYGMLMHATGATVSHAVRIWKPAVSHALRGDALELGRMEVVKVLASSGARIDDALMMEFFLKFIVRERPLCAKTLINMMPGLDYDGILDDVVRTKMRRREDIINVAINNGATVPSGSLTMALFSVAKYREFTRHPRLPDFEEAARKAVYGRVKQPIHTLSTLSDCGAFAIYQILKKFYEEKCHSENLYEASKREFLRKNVASFHDRLRKRFCNRYDRILCTIFERTYFYTLPSDLMRDVLEESNGLAKGNIELSSWILSLVQELSPNKGKIDVDISLLELLIYLQEVTF